MSGTSPFASRCAVLAGGLLGTVALPFFVGPAAVGLLSGPVSELFKGLTGDYFPSFSKAILQRLRDQDPSKLNHHVLKGLIHALEQTEKSIRFRYKSQHDTALSSDGKVYLHDLCEAIEIELGARLKGDPDRMKVDALLERNHASDEDLLMEACREHRRAIERNDPKLDKVIEDYFLADLRLHFAEYIKDPAHPEARVAFEQLTSDALLQQVRGMSAQLERLGAMDHKLDILLSRAVQQGDAPALEHNITTWTEEYRSVEQVQVIMHSSVDQGLKALDGKLVELTTLAERIHDRTVIIDHGVKEVSTTGRTNTKLILVVLAAVLGVALFFVVDPMHLRSFPLKVEIDQPLDYGMNDRVAQRIAIAYGDGLRDTTTVKEGFASFSIPDQYRNDDAVLRLLCVGKGQTMREAAVCDSHTVRLTDQDRVLFPPTQKTDVPAMVKNKVQPAMGKTGNGATAERPTSDAAVRSGSKPPCAMEGLEFLNDGSLEDRLTLSGYSGGTVSISGEVNRKPVDGRLRVNGVVLSVIANEGTLLGGRLELVQGCAQLKGSLRVHSATGNAISERVNMVSNAP